MKTITILIILLVGITVLAGCTTQEPTPPRNIQEPFQEEPVEEEVASPEDLENIPQPPTLPEE